MEFKENNAEPHLIGEYLSEFANSAALDGKAFAFLVWGVRDSDQAIVRTRVDPWKAMVRNEELESWLLRLLEPKPHFSFFAVEIDGQRVVLLEIARAQRQPVRFEGIEFIRVGSIKKKLKDVPEKERRICACLTRRPSRSHASTPPATRYCLCSITRAGAALFAKKLTDFGTLGRKAVRTIVYDGVSRLRTLKEQVDPKGYAAGFETLIAFVNGLVPSNEVIGQAQRESVPMYPELAVRELVANALIHQDFFVTGAGPMVEIFADRMEVTNPGKPLVATDRFVHAPPRSRNDALASLMRRMGICEDRGSGVDKIVSQTEAYQLPAPLLKCPTTRRGRCSSRTARSPAWMPRSVCVPVTSTGACVT